MSQDKPLIEPLPKSWCNNCWCKGAVTDETGRCPHCHIVSYRIIPVNTPRPIQVWRFDDAPKELQALSAHGGDEDWLALVPPNLVNEYLGWAQSGTSFGCCDVSEDYLPDGSKVLIGAHS